MCADDDKCETLFCRSGLRDTASRVFADLPVYRALKAFLQVRQAGTMQAGCNSSNCWPRCNQPLEQVQDVLES